ncbi:MAG: carbohydrate ABC transporter permease [Defluviitaleaceae bacterium]|nr:carbohydrate ABC transporter permease [Defluviitaleaceae bacterium]
MKKRRNVFRIAYTYYRTIREVRLSRSKAGTVGILLFLLIISTMMFFPFYLTVIQSFKPIEEFFYWPPRFYVINPTGRNYSIVFRVIDNWMVPMTRFMFNSIFTAVAGTAMAVVLSCLAAYPLAKGKIPGMKFLTAVVIGTLLFSNNSMDFFRYIILSGLRMVDTYWALIIPWISGTMYVFLIRQFIIGTMQDEIIEASRIDGASEYTILFKIVMPMIKPAILTMIVYAFPTIWTAVGTGVYTENLRTLPSVIGQIAMGGTAFSGPASAAGVMIMVPSLVIFIYSQRSIMATMAYSGIK